MLSPTNLTCFQNNLFNKTTQISVTQIKSKEFRYIFHIYKSLLIHITHEFCKLPGQPHIFLTYNIGTMLYVNHD